MKFDKDVEKAFELIMEKAKKRKDDAGMSGRMDDGGYSATESKIETFKDGVRFERAGVLPEWLEGAVKEVKDKQDPEYVEYLRLKEKFN